MCISGGGAHLGECDDLQNNVDGDGGRMQPLADVRDELSLQTAQVEQLRGVDQREHVLDARPVDECRGNKPVVHVLHDLLQLIGTCCSTANLKHMVVHVAHQDARAVRRGKQFLKLPAGVHEHNAMGVKGASVDHERDIAQIGVVHVAGVDARCV